MEFLIYYPIINRAKYWAKYEPLTQFYGIAQNEHSFQESFSYFFLLELQCDLTFNYIEKRLLDSHCVLNVDRFDLLNGYGGVSSCEKVKERSGNKLATVLSCSQPDRHFKLKRIIEINPMSPFICGITFCFSSKINEKMGYTFPNTEGERTLFFFSFHSITALVRMLKLEHFCNSELEKFGGTCPLCIKSLLLLVFTKYYIFIDVVLTQKFCNTIWLIKK